jgi:hypothetical protein
MHLANHESEDRGCRSEGARVDARDVIGSVVHMYRGSNISAVSVPELREAI